MTTVTPLLFYCYFKIGDRRVDTDKAKIRKTKGVETKNKIYESAAQLFKQHGFDNVSVDSIVEKAGVSKGTFYVHFSNKNALIGDFVENLNLDYEAYTENLPDNLSASEMLIIVAGKIADNISDLIGYDLMKIVYVAQVNRQINNRALLGHRIKIQAIFEKILAHGIQQGEFESTLDIEFIMNHFIICIRGITYEWSIMYPNYNLKEEAQKHFEILLKGIIKR